MKERLSALFRVRSFMALLLALGMLASVGLPSASAASSDEGSNRIDTSIPDFAPSVSERNSSKVRDDFARHLESVQREISEAGEGKVISVNRVDFEPESSTDVPGDPGTVTSKAYPGGCGLSVVLFTSAGYVRNASLTSCPVPATEMSMISTVQKKDLFWLTWSQVAREGNWAPMDTSVTTRAVYKCPNSNRSGFKAVTSGELRIGKVKYTASAYDGVEYYNCG